MRSAIIAGMFALALAPLWSAGACAAPVRLDCTLEGPKVDGKVTTRTVTVIFDADGDRLSLQQDTQRQDFAHVTISTVSINGSTNDMSLGIDRSSWSIVLQTYGADRIERQYGTCRQPASKP